MATPDAERREPLWAASLAHEPQRRDEAVGPAAPRTAVPAGVERRQGSGVVALGVFAAMIAAALAVTLAGRGSLVVKDVPSYWVDVPMRCHTARFEDGRRALELFRCRATGGGALPPGVYRSPGAQWTSDLTRRDARADEIRISPGGELTGWAAY